LIHVFTYRGANPFDQLKQPLDTYDFQISDHAGSHARVNIGIFFARPTKASTTFFAHVAQFWIRYGKGPRITDQRVLDAMLNNYDKLQPIYRRVSGGVPPPSLNWTTHSFGSQVSHMMVEGSAFYVFDQAARLDLRSKKFYGGLKAKYFTVTITDKYILSIVFFKLICTFFHCSQGYENQGAQSSSSCSTYFAAVSVDESDTHLTGIHR
jgi:hypothetical protein